MPRQMSNKREELKKQKVAIKRKILSEPMQQWLSKVTEKVNKEIRANKNGVKSPKSQEQERRIVIKQKGTNNNATKISKDEPKKVKSPRVRSKVVVPGVAMENETAILPQEINVKVEHFQDDRTEESFIPDYEEVMEDGDFPDQSSGDESTEYEDDDEDAEVRIKKIKRKEIDIDEEERLIRENPAIMNVLKKMVQEALQEKSAPQVVGNECGETKDVENE